MDSPLFRLEAVEARRHAGRGEPLVTSPIATSVFAFAALALVVLAGLFVCTVEVPRRVTVQGYLEPEGGMIRLRAPVVGVIAEVSTRVGAEVAAGDPLLRLETRRSTPDAPDVAGATARDFEAVARELGAQRRVIERGIARDRARFERRRTVLDAQRALLERQRDAVRQRQVQAQRRVLELEPAARAGHVPRAQLQQQEDRATELALEGLRLDEALLANARQADDLIGERDERDRQTALKLAELDAARSRLALERRNATLDHEVVLRAPTAGTVLRVPFEVGATLHPGQLAVAIAPAAAPLRAVLLVPSREAGMIAPGQPVVLRLSAFPYQRFGVRRAMVLRVAGSVRLPSEPELPAPLSEPAFEVVAALDDAWLTAYGRRWPLRAELALEADIVLERATLAARLLDPLRAMTRRSG